MSRRFFARCLAALIAGLSLATFGAVATRKSRNRLRAGKAPAGTVKAPVQSRQIG
ncbi:MAG: hypothetical protein K8F58_13480 [Bauldia sp.]|nr:hypothetical protein [Bauldia sp.]